MVSQIRQHRSSYKSTKKNRRCPKTITRAPAAATSYPKKKPPSQDTTPKILYATSTAPDVEKSSPADRDKLVLKNSHICAAY